MESLDRIIGKADQLLSTHGEELTDLALYAARLEAISFILFGFITASITATLIYATYRVSTSCASCTDKEVMSTLSAFGAILFFFFTVICWADLTTWVGMFQPEVYLMSEILGKVK